MKLHNEVTLYGTFVNAYSHIAALKWRVYDTNNHNRLITDDYGSLKIDDYDDLIVTSLEVRCTKSGIKYAAVYIRKGE